MFTTKNTHAKKIMYCMCTRKKKKSIETLSEEAQILDFLDIDLKWASMNILNLATEQLKCLNN